MDKSITSGDLFCENFGLAKSTHGTKLTEKDLFGYRVIFGETDTKHREGRYATIECGRIWEAKDLHGLTSALAETIRDISDNAVSFAPERILVAAFGNSRVTPDSVGTRSADMIVPSGRRDVRGTPQVFVIKTGVPAAVGMDSVEVTSAFAGYARAQLILCIDALAASTAERLGTVLQVTDAGFAPGSGLSSRATAVSCASMGIPVVAIGIPTVIRDGKAGVIYTCAEADLLANRAAAVIAGGINGYLYSRKKDHE